MQKNMTEHNAPSSFWQGFAFGVASIAGIAYAFGTQTGRNRIKELINFLEEHQTNADSLFSAIDSILNNSENQNKSAANQNQPDLKTIIDKVKSVTNQ